MSDVPIAKKKEKNATHIGKKILIPMIGEMLINKLPANLVVIPIISVVSANDA
jgi:hypothetical protein